MPTRSRKGWTTAEQLQWLLDWVPAYNALRTTGRGRLGKFWLDLFDGWFSLWPGNDVEYDKKVCIVFLFNQGQLTDCPQ